MSERENAMVQQALSVPQLLQLVYPDLEHQVRYVLTTPQIYSVKKIVLTSCGDGYAACLAAKRAFERFVQIPIDVVEPLTLSSYYQMKWVGESPCDPLVIAISNSGRVTRVTEAVQRMRAHNALTIAVTSDPQSPLGQAAEKHIVPTIPAFVPSPGVRSYAVLQMIVYLMAIRMGEVRLKYTMDQANLYRRELLQLPEQFLADAGQVQTLAMHTAELFKDAQSAEMIGCGADSGPAWYAHAKMYEAVGLPATMLDSETWFHINYFVRDVAHTLTMVFASKANEASSRTKELVTRLNQMGRTFVLITDDDTLQAPLRFLLPESASGLFHAMDAHLAAAMIAGNLAQLRGETYSRGFEGIWHEEPGMYSTTVSDAIIAE